MHTYFCFFFFLNTLTLSFFFFFFFNDTATTEIYTLSLHDALPISRRRPGRIPGHRPGGRATARARACVSSRPLSQRGVLDRKSTRLSSSHDQISYAVFCLKKKKKTKKITRDIKHRVSRKI